MTKLSSLISLTQKNHIWKFFKAGGFYQVKLETGADLLHLDELDQKLWVALACPTRGLEFDERTLDLIDTNNDGRIRAPELIACVQWTCSLLKNPDDIVASLDPLPLSSISETSAEGKELLAAAKQILMNVGKGDADSISVADASDANKIFSNTIFNGDGVIIPESADDEATKSVIVDIMTCMGTAPDRSGKAGIHQKLSDTFFVDATAYAAWHQKTVMDPDQLLPAGDGTWAAAAAVNAIRAKVDDYFGRCRLAAFDPRTLPLLNRKEDAYSAILSHDISITATEVAEFPLAVVAADKPLPLQGAVNPAHAAALTALQHHAVIPLLGQKDVLSETDWALLKTRLKGFEDWLASKPGISVEKLGIERVRAILASNAQDEINHLLIKDKMLELESNSIESVEKLTRFVRDLHLLCINFVSFRDLYHRKEMAMFQCGTLYLDQRSCTLCLRVQNPTRHATMAGLAGAYLAYCDCTRTGTEEKFSIVAVFSQGDDDNLMLGRNGIFYDRNGLDYDATITKIVANPISLRQAFWLPYKKFVRMIEEMISKRAAEADAESNLQLQSVASSLVTADKPKAAATKKIDVGTVAALGVAFGAIGGFFTAVASGLVQIASFGPLAVVGTIISVMALISGPSLLLAFIKLRKRNLGPILDANGWAVNAKTKINVPFGTAMTGIAILPPGSQKDLTDPFSEKRRLWPILLVIAAVLYIAFSILNQLGYVFQWSAGRMGTERKKPAVEQPADQASPAGVKVPTPEK